MDGRWLVGGVALSVALLLPALAAAAPIEWEAPADCPGTDAVLAGLRQALGAEEIELGAVSRVRGVVVAANGASAARTRYRLTLEVVEHDRRSTRSFEAERCDDLARTAALAISLAVHSGSRESDSATSAPPETATSPQADPPRQPSDAGAGLDPTNGSGSARATWWAAGANAVLDIGALPEAAVGIGLEARAGFGAFDLDLHAVLLPSQRRVVGAGDSVELGLMTAGLRACLRLFDRALWVAGCVGAEAGRFTAEGVGLNPRREVHDPWLAVGPAALVRTAFQGPLQLQFLAEPLVPLARKRYAVDGTDIVHSPSVVDLRVQAGLVLSD